MFTLGKILNTLNGFCSSPSSTFRCYTEPPCGLVESRRRLTLRAKPSRLDHSTVPAGCYCNLFSNIKRLWDCSVSIFVFYTFVYFRIGFNNHRESFYLIYCVHCVQCRRLTYSDDVRKCVDHWKPCEHQR